MSHKILILGDFFIDNIQGQKQHSLEGFDDVIVNCEAPLLDGQLAPELKLGPSLKMSPCVSVSLKKIGVSICCLANNHIMDFGATGLINTVRVLRESGIDSVGYCDGANELFIERGDYIIFNFAQRENGFSENGNVGYLGYSFLESLETVKSLSERKKVIVIYHGGIEGVDYPNKALITGARALIDHGASCVVCHHSHTISSCEIYKDKLIHYGIGNYLFERNGKNTSNGEAVELLLNENLISYRVLKLSKEGELGAERIINPLESINWNVIQRSIYDHDDFNHLIHKLLGRSKLIVKLRSLLGLKPLDGISKYRRKVLYTLLSNEAHLDIIKEKLK